MAAGLSGLQANIVTERWVGWDPLDYTASRGWAPDQMTAATDALAGRGLLAGDRLSTEGTELRESVELTTDRIVQPVVDALGSDRDDVVRLLDDWSRQVVEHGWFPPDPYKRASG